jgi:hypothetical protein
LAKPLHALPAGACQKYTEEQQRLPEQKKHCFSFLGRSYRTRCPVEATTTGAGRQTRTNYRLGWAQSIHFHPLRRMAIIAAGFCNLRLLALQNCKGEI